MAVLSIDIQRLEVSTVVPCFFSISDKFHTFQLDELLHRDRALAPSLLRQDSGNMKQTRSGWAKLGYALKKLLKGRAGTNVSLVLVRVPNLLSLSTLILRSSLQSLRLSIIRRTRPIRADHRQNPKPPYELYLGS